MTKIVRKAGKDNRTFAFWLGPDDEVRMWEEFPGEFTANEAVDAFGSDVGLPAREFDAECSGTTLSALRDELGEGERVAMDPPVCVCGDHFTDDALCYDCRRDTERSLQEAELSVARLTAEVERLREALRPFVHPDLCESLGGNVQGDDSPIYGRNRAVLRIGDFRRAALALPTPAPEAKE